MSEPSVPSKTCQTCHNIKPIHELVKSSRAKDGYRNICKSCYAARYRTYYKTARGKEVIKKSVTNYLNTPRGQQVKQAAAERLKAFMQTPEGKEWRRIRHDKYKPTREAWMASPKGKALKQRSAALKKEWLKTPKGRECLKRQTEKQKKESWPFKYRLKKFGWTIDDYNSAFDAQDGRCAICGHRPLKRLAIDHCHISNSVRGLLCSHCNLSLGLLQDDVHLLLNACEYLLKHHASLLENTDGT